MNCFIFIAISYESSSVAFASGSFNLSYAPSVGEYLIIEPEVDASPNPQGLCFLISMVRSPSDAAKGGGDLALIVTCDNDAFTTREEANSAVLRLQDKGFIVEGL